MNIAVIPARGGSRRIPRKNIKEFCGRPIIAWPILAAKESKLFDHVIVSTDDAEIADVARQFGAETPFVRPGEIADEYTGTTAVVAHATRWALGAGWPVSAVCCIYATASLVRADDLGKAFEMLSSGDWQFAFAATTFDSSIFRSFRELTDGGVEMFFPEHFATRSQDLPVALHDAGQFYWGRTQAWAEEMRIFEKHSLPCVIPRWRVQDIDEPEDWVRAESIFRELRK